MNRWIERDISQKKRAWTSRKAVLVCLGGVALSWRADAMAMRLMDVSGGGSSRVRHDVSIGSSWGFHNA